MKKLAFTFENWWGKKHLSVLFKFICNLHYNPHESEKNNSNSHFGQIVGRIKKYFRIFGRTQRFAPTSNAGFRAIVGANLVFARP